jgi:hypothetical protein
MPVIPLISTDTALFDRLKAVIDSRPQDGYNLKLLSTLKAAEDFLSDRKPELVFINFSDTLPLLEAPYRDLWLRQGGIIALCEECSTIDRINALQDAAILISLTFADIELQLSGILDIIHANRPLLSRPVRPDPRAVLSGSSRMHNNFLEAACYINLVCAYLYSAKKLTLERIYFFHLPLYEMLVNAIEHGNCGISYEEKSRFLERGGCASDLIQEKCKDPAVAGKMVSLTHELHPSYARFVIADEGEGFDWRTVIRTMPHENPLRLHGRGILITRALVRTLHYNNKGNTVTFEIDYTSPPDACRLPLRT